MLHKVEKMSMDELFQSKKRDQGGEKPLLQSLRHEQDDLLLALDK